MTNKQPDDSEYIKKLLYSDVKIEYARLYEINREIEEKAQRILTRVFTVVALVFTGIGLLTQASLSFNYFQISFWVASVLVFVLLLTLFSSILLQRAMKWEVIDPQKLSKIDESIQDKIKLYDHLKAEFGKAGNNIFNIIESRGSLLRLTSIFELISFGIISIWLLITMFALVHIL